MSSSPTPSASDKIPHLDLAGFEALRANPSSPAVTLLDFTAAWCPPCRTLGAVLRELVDEYAGRVRFVAIDTDHEPLLAQQFNVRANPTIVLWRDGVEVGRAVGARQRRFVAGMLDRALAGDTQIACP